jgi:transcriptional regulator GlxA family with amidase domain
VALLCRIWLYGGQACVQLGAEQGPRVEWVREARWVQDGNRWTSSGVAAGIDMGFALLAQLRGEEAAAGIGSAIEYEWHRDASWDPFAATNLQGR